MTVDAFLLPHLERLSSEYRITLCMNTAGSAVRPAVPDGVRVMPFDLRRKISLSADLQVLWRLYRFLRSERFDLVFTMTPKSGLLGMLAAWLARVPRRVHCFSGQVWANRRGVSRCFFKWLDRLLCVCATYLLVDGRSQRQFLIEQGIVAADRAAVLVETSVISVDPRFRPDPAARQRMRDALGIPDTACCLLFVGRLNREKGIEDLLGAFEGLRESHPELHFLVVGPDEDNLAPLLAGRTAVHQAGYTRDVPHYMAAGDILCLPSYREGFGLVLIEAGAAGLPVVASRIYGIADALVEGQTGLAHRPGDTGDLTAQLERLIRDPALRARMGEAGRQRALTCFTAEKVTEALAGFLREQIRTIKYL